MDSPRIFLSWPQCKFLRCRPRYTIIGRSYLAARRKDPKNAAPYDL